jgi:hypothetical protein
MVSKLAAHVHAPETVMEMGMGTISAGSKQSKSRHVAAYGRF